ncbi:MAG TPA: hypothetical protein PLE19_18325 [Planctomycetota bacterium]|nr:hypothetical protein [Planctomycetota bacterium]HRR79692.1 hypothetical protein [Planctomycetota bacterium]HRT95919.1 hypothetical protein [Planctomycetota bacterium]
MLLRRRFVWMLALNSFAAACAAAAAGDAPKAVGIVSHVKVLSDKVEDVSSLDAWRKSFLRDTLSDRDKALAAWESVVRFQHQDAPPVEYLQMEDMVLDAIKMFNVYGYSMCGNAASHVQSLARAAGLEARGWTIQGHVVPEVLWDGKWHLLDASLINYFPKPDGDLASVEEIAAAIKEWYDKNPGFKGNDAKLRQFHAENGWTGWKRGPALLAACPFYTADGWLPARTHGWYATMQEYDGSTLFAYENGYSVGYQVNVQLRPGERLTRNWGHKGLHINMDGAGGAPGCLTMKPGERFMIYTPRYGDLANGRVGNGTLEYEPPLADGSLAAAALACENLDFRGERKDGPALFAKDAAQPATLVLRMPSSYVYLGGELTLKAAVGTGGEIALAFSDNNGLDWRELGRFTASGDQKLDLKPHVYRRYDYRLKFTLKGASTGLDALKITHDIQHSQRPLPALDRGENTITFSAEPSEGTITVEGSTDPKNKGKQVLYTDFHPERKNIKDDLLVLSAATGEVTFPIETPGEMTRLRVGIYYRARDPKDAWDIAASFDGGKTWQPIGHCEGPTRNHGKYFVLDKVPAGTRSALVRFTGTQRTVAMIYQTRIDADYREPHGGFRPVKVTYTWEEGAAEKRHVHVAQKPAETYTIFCASKPTMRSLIVELAQ